MSVITLRLPEDLKQRLVTMAENRGESLNHLLESIATQALVADETTRRILSRRARGKAERALSILDRVPDRAPLLEESLSTRAPGQTTVRPPAAASSRRARKKAG